MKKSKLTGEQIAFALRQAEVGTPVAEVSRKMGLSEATYNHSVIGRAKLPDYGL